MWKWIDKWSTMFKAGRHRFSKFFQKILKFISFSQILARVNWTQILASTKQGFLIFKRNADKIKKEKRKYEKKKGKILSPPSELLFSRLLKQINIGWFPEKSLPV